ncbi:DUF3883 domain-containing protein [Leptolyngbya sp. CCY15150]|uniref:protein NO VEIN domain-containing protein n=1 Tax=Leptolyngbya sp. CCY15150 TaxID=2767772 RepID=UPI0019505F8A
MSKGHVIFEWGAMRSISELIEFLDQTMSMTAVYQPVVILHLLTRNGIASRKELARALGGYDRSDISEWDKILMDNPKRWLVGKHEILSYHKDSQNFSLNVDLSDRPGVDQAIKLCVEKITDWISRAIERNSLDEAEILRLYQVLDSARHGGYDQEADVDSETDEFAMAVSVQLLHQDYPDQPITQQPHDTLGFDILVGTVQAPIAYVNVKATPALMPTIALSEGERQFSIEQSDKFIVMVIYAINLAAHAYRVARHTGAIQPQTNVLVPTRWKLMLSESS